MCINTYTYIGCIHIRLWRRLQSPQYRITYWYVHLISVSGVWLCRRMQCEAHIRVGKKKEEAHSTVGKNKKWRSPYRSRKYKKNKTRCTTATYHDNKSVGWRVAAGKKKNIKEHIVQQGNTRKIRGLVRVSPLRVASHLPFVSKSFVCPTFSLF